MIPENDDASRDRLERLIDKTLIISMMLVIFGIGGIIIMEGIRACS